MAAAGRLWLPALHRVCGQCDLAAAQQGDPRTGPIEVSVRKPRVPVDWASDIRRRSGLRPHRGSPRTLSSIWCSSPRATPLGAADRKRVWVMVAAAGVVVVLAVAGTVLAFAITSRKPDAVLPHAYGPQIVLPFTGLSWPAFIAVDAAGNVYVSGSGVSGERLVLKLPVASPT